MWRLCKYLFLANLGLLVGWVLYMGFWGNEHGLSVRRTEALLTDSRQALDTMKRQNDLFTRDYAKDGLAPGQGVRTTAQAAEKTCSYTRPNCTVTHAAIAASSKADYDTATALIQADDFEALARMILVGRATKLEPGTKVTLVSESPWTGRAQVRLRGDFTELWMARDALR